MSKNILIVSTSPRKGGNSDVLADAFLKGAESVGNIVEKICLYNKEINFCKGCLSCQKTKKCVIHDDANIIIEKMYKADIIVFATPIYYYEMCGQMKTIIDRSNPLFTADYKFRDVYLLATAADREISAIDGAIKGIEGWISCFEKSKLMGIICGVGVTDIGDIKDSSYLEEAYKMGAVII